MDRRMTPGEKPEEKPEAELAQKLLPKLRPDFAEREATALQFAELLLDAVDAALPLTQHAPAELALPQLELLGQQTDVFSWEGAPGWDVVLQRGLVERPVLPAGALVLDGLGEPLERTQQRGELKRRAQHEAARLLQHGRDAALIQSHASLLRLAGFGAAFSLLQPPPDPQAGELPPGSLQDLARDLDERGEGFVNAQDEWLATLLSKNPALAAPQFRTFFAGLSQSLRAVRTLHEGPPYDLEALLAAVVSWQPQRWTAMRTGAPSAWISQLCPSSPVSLAQQSAAALSLFARLWFARDASLCAMHALAALFMARCATIAALCEELAKDRAGD
jgi:hypothetical protein